MIAPEGVPPESLAVLLRKLDEEYCGVLPPGGLDEHVREYVGLDAARQLVDVVDARGGQRILDVGCGYGAFVLAARQAGHDAVGIDVASFEVKFARERLQRLRPMDDADAVYRLGDGGRLPFPDASFEVVTLWNVLEHVPTPGPVLVEAARVLSRGGRLHLVCPNYAALREEAHYHVVWPSLLPRGLASRYLRARGKDPAFFEAGIHYRTNREVLRAVRAAGLLPEDPRITKLASPERIASPRARRLVEAARRAYLLPLVRAAARASFENPFRASVRLSARKEA